MNPEKLYERVTDANLQNVRFPDFVRLVAWMGFRQSRQRGSHRFLVHDRVNEILNLRPVGNVARPYPIEQFLDLVERWNLPTPGEQE